ncbi:MAG TPA: MFS transporter [Anaerolineae bacterium]|nr:MFS transporter [Anaerolineae bacterium]
MGIRLLHHLGGTGGLVSAYALFLLAMVIITIGEMMTPPTSQALVARFAPEDMQGRYMAMYGFSWVIPSTIGPLLAGLVMDNADPRWAWYGAGLAGLMAAMAFALLQRRVVGRSGAKKTQASKIAPSTRCRKIRSPASE